MYTIYPFNLKGVIPLLFNKTSYNIASVLFHSQLSVAPNRRRTITGVRCRWRDHVCCWSLSPASVRAMFSQMLWHAKFTRKRRRPPLRMGLRWSIVRHNRRPKRHYDDKDDDDGPAMVVPKLFGCAIRVVFRRVIQDIRKQSRIELQEYEYKWSMLEMCYKKYILIYNCSSKVAEQNYS